MHNWYRITASLTIILALVACGAGVDRDAWRGTGVAVLQTITVDSTNTSIAKDLATQFTATGNYSDGSSLDITSLVKWNSGNTLVATVNASGLASGIAAGKAVITATLGTISGNKMLTVVLLQSITVTPANSSIYLKASNTPFETGTQQFTATANYSDGTSQNVTAYVSWTSGTTSVATVNASGLASGVNTGSTVITATFGALSGSTFLTTNLLYTIF